MLLFPHCIVDDPSSCIQSLATETSHVAMARSRSASLSDPKQAMELLRTLVQPLIDTDIQAVMKKYVDAYFRPAAINARKNLGEENVSARLVEDVCLTAIDRARDAFDLGKKATAAGGGGDPLMASAAVAVAAATCDAKPVVLGGTTSAVAAVVPPPGLVIGLKRKASMPPVPAPHVVPKKKKKKKRKQAGGEGSGEQQPLVKPYTDVIVISKSGKPVRREGPKWEPERFVDDMLFILGSKANKALGYGQTRGRLYIKHPELFK